MTGILAAAATPVSAQEEPGFTQLFRIEYLRRTVSKERVKPGEEFYITVATRITLSRRFNIPWEVTGEYQVFGIHHDQDPEVVLGEGVSHAGPFGEIQAGESISYEHQVIATFPEDAPYGKYTIFVRPVKVSPWFLWMAFEALVPDRARLGEVEVVPPPTPTPTPAPSPAATLTPLPTPPPAATPVTVPPLQTPAPTPTPAPAPSPAATPTPPPPSGGTPWRAIALTSLVVAVAAGGAVLWRRVA